MLISVKLEQQQQPGPPVAPGAPPHVLPKCPECSWVCGLSRTCTEHTPPDGLRGPPDNPQQRLRQRRIHAARRHGAGHGCVLSPLISSLLVTSSSRFAAFLLFSSHGAPLLVLPPLSSSCFCLFSQTKTRQVRCPLVLLLSPAPLIPFWFCCLLSLLSFSCLPFWFCCFLVANSVEVELVVSAPVPEGAFLSFCCCHLLRLSRLVLPLLVLLPPLCQFSGIRAGHQRPTKHPTRA